MFLLTEEEVSLTAKCLWSPDLGKSKILPPGGPAEGGVDESLGSGTALGVK